ncbi:MAG: SRPBCC domain-containing protein, partial [Chloroflexi bacterium]
MAKPFEVRAEIETEASPEEAWEAISTGRGMDAWFMGTNEIEPRLGGAARTTLAGFTIESKVTAWDPPHRLVTDSGEGEDGR